MMKYLIVILLFVVGCTSALFKNSESARMPNAYESTSTVKNLNFQELQTILISTESKSIEQSLQFLSPRYTDYFSFHTLMYDSLSLHESSLLEPRVIVFGSDARFVLSFNGGAHQRGGNSFETMEYSNETKRFLFREIEFKNKNGELETDLDPAEIAFRNKDFVISKPNPGKCIQCHANATPIWETYFLWPGAYGSNDDNLSFIFDRNNWNPNNEKFFKTSTTPQSQGRTMQLEAGSVDNEVKGYASYATAKSSHPRYQWLPNKIQEAAILSFVQGKSTVPDLSSAFENERKRVGAAYGWPSRPNGFLLDRLSELNDQRMIADASSKNLQGLFRSLPWKSFFEARSNLKEKNSIKALATIVDEIFANFTFEKSRPTIAQIELALRKNLQDEIGMQREKVYRQQSNLAPAKLVLLAPDLNYTRSSMGWITNANTFYKDLLKLPNLTEEDRIAFSLEADDIVLATAMDIMLKDRNFSLHDYNMNMRQQSLSFNSAGLRKLFSFLQ